MVQTKKASAFDEVHVGAIRIVKIFARAGKVWEESKVETHSHNQRKQGIIVAFFPDGGERYLTHDMGDTTETWVSLAR
jgi:hypothetical protein